MHLQLPTNQVVLLPLLQLNTRKFQTHLQVCCNQSLTDNSVQMMASFLTAKPASPSRPVGFCWEEKGRNNKMQIRSDRGLTFGNLSNCQASFVVPSPPAPTQPRSDLCPLTNPTPGPLRRHAPVHSNPNQASLYHRHPLRPMSSCRWPIRSQAVSAIMPLASSTPTQPRATTSYHALRRYC